VFKAATEFLIFGKAQSDDQTISANYSGFQITTQTGTVKIDGF
jgi:hypothetical protein